MKAFIETRMYVQRWVVMSVSYCPFIRLSLATFCATTDNKPASEISAGSVTLAWFLRWRFFKTVFKGYGVKTNPLLERKYR